MMAAMAEGFNKEEAIKGLRFNRSNTRSLNTTMETEEDYRMIVSILNDDKIQKDKEFTATSMLKEYKVDNCKLSFEDFMKMYMQDGVLVAIRRLFWDDVIQEDVDKYLNAYLKKYSLAELYTNYMKKPHTPFLKFVKNI